MKNNLFSLLLCSLSLFLFAAGVQAQEPGNPDDGAAVTDTMTYVFDTLTDANCECTAEDTSELELCLRKFLKKTLGAFLPALKLNHESVRDAKRALADEADSIIGLCEESGDSGGEDSPDGGGLDG